MPQREFPESPLVGVGAVIVDDRGCVLLVKRATEPRKGHWSIPGGLIEVGESLLEGVVREVEEETRLTVRPEAIVEVVERIYRESLEAPVRYHYVIIDYWCRVISGVAKPASDAAELLWAFPAEWREANPHRLEDLTIAVIEKGWQMALAAGAHG